MPKAKDLTGMKFGRLTAIKLSEERKNGHAVWLCKCDCGNVVFVSTNNLNSGNTKSCGGTKHPRLDLTGQRFGRLIVVEPSEKRKRGKFVWKCRCDCGQYAFVITNNLTSGTTKSCGCSRQESFHSKTHEGSHDRLYRVWAAMIQRCTNPNDKNYKNYGDRGITICEEWRYNYPTFKDWSYSHGYDPSAPRGDCTLDRINNDLGYSPENCRWVDMKIQRANRRDSKKTKS